MSVAPCVALVPYRSTSSAGLSTGVQHLLSSSRRSSTASVTPLGLGAARTPLRQWWMWARRERIHPPIRPIALMYC
jgi:hypothetical protein